MIMKERRDRMKLSIIIPAYNVEAYIPRTLESLAAQTVPDFETIVVNDGSTDGTEETVRRFAATGRLNRIRIVSQANGGVSAARNRGLQEASGDYVLFLDGDDYTAPDLVESIFGSLESEPEPDLLFWKWKLVSEEGKVLKDLYGPAPGLPAAMTSAEVLRGVLVEQRLELWTASVAYRRELLTAQGIRYTEGCVNGEDQEFTYKALARGRTAAFIDRYLSFYLERNTSISGVYNVKKFGFADAFARAAAFMQERPELKEASEALLLRHMLDNYFYNLKTCLRSGGKVSIRRLLQDIDRAYPGLNGRMKERMQHWRRENRGIKPDIHSFLIAPELLQMLLAWQLAGIRFRSAVSARFPAVSRLRGKETAAGS